jgi:hypothetical protein
MVGPSSKVVELARMQERQMEMVATKGKLSEWREPRKFYEPAEAVLLVEELRRMMPELTGNPDLPMERVVFKRRLSS